MPLKITKPIAPAVSTQQKYPVVATKYGQDGCGRCKREPPVYPGTLCSKCKKELGLQ